MAFIPKIIQFDTTDETPMSTLARTGRLNEIDNVVKEYIVQNINHEFVQYLMDDEKFLGFVVKVPYDIDIDKNYELNTPLLDLNESGPSLREEQIEKNRMAEEARMENHKNYLEGERLRKFKDYDSLPEYYAYRKKRMEIAKKNSEASEHSTNTESTNLGGTKRRKRRTKRTKKRR
jgi:hypothetical protein